MPGMSRRAVLRAVGVTGVGSGLAYSAFGMRSFSKEGREKASETPTATATTESDRDGPQGANPFSSFTTKDT